MVGIPAGPRFSSVDSIFFSLSLLTNNHKLSLNVLAYAVSISQLCSPLVYQILQRTVTNAVELDVSSHLVC